MTNHNQIFEHLTDLALQAGVQHVQLFFEDCKDFFTTSQNSTAAQIQEKRHQGLGILLLSEQAQGYAATIDVSSSGCLAAMERALQQIGCQLPTAHAVLEPDFLFEEDAHSSFGLQAAIEKQELGCQTIGWEQWQRLLCYDSVHGLSADQRHLGSLICELPFNNTRLFERSAGWSDQAPDLSRLLADLSQTIHASYALHQSGTRLPEGHYPAVMEAGAAGMLFHEVGHLFEDRDGSAQFPLTESLPSRLTLLDRPDLPLYYGSVSIDDEGSLPRDVLLIDRGRTKRPIANRFHQSGFRPDATGNARRQDFRYRPRVRMNNLVVPPGITPLQTLIQSVHDGVLIQKISGGQANHRTGEIYLKVEEARRIRSGLAAEPLLPFVIQQDMSQLLHGIQLLGDDPFTLSVSCKGSSGVVPVSLTSPSLLLEQVNIRGYQP